jgi:hypothetical protein
VEAIYKRSVVTHLSWHGPEQVSNPLLALHIGVEVADHLDAAIGPDALPSTTELARLHVPLHDVDAVLVVEGDARHLVEAHDIVLGDETVQDKGTEVSCDSWVFPD